MTRPDIDAMTETPERQEAAEVYRAEEAGCLTNHCSDDSGLPDVGMSLGLGDGRMLFVGDNPDGQGTALVIYEPHDRTVIAQPCDREAGYEMLNALATIIRRLEVQVCRRGKWIDSGKAERDAARAEVDRLTAARPSQAGDAKRVQAMRDANWRPAVDYWRERAEKAEAALAAMDTPRGGGDGWQPIETCGSGGGPVLIYNPGMESDPEWPSHAVHVSNRDYVTSGNAKKAGFTAWHPVPPAPPAAMKDGGE